MSKIKGIFPLFLATTFGIFNGIAIFGPEFKKHETEKLGKQQQQNEVAHVPDPTAIETLKEAETEANGAGATQRLDKPERSRWSIIRFWEQAKSEEERREAAEPVTADPSAFSQSGVCTSTYARHLQRADVYVRFYGGKAPPPSQFRSTRGILEQSHQTTRDGKNRSICSDSASRDQHLANKYYGALCGQFALVGLSRSEYQKVAHNHIVESKSQGRRGLHTLELKFAYEEAGGKKNALVKV